MREIQKLKEEILKEYPRLSKDSAFCFACHPGVPCFNDCCSDVNIFLTPYDVIRLKHALGITSQEFIDKYTLFPIDRNLTYPVVLLRMNDDDKKTCQFVTEKGCSVYDNRPWACRMYPLGLASPKDDNPGLNEEFYFLLKESVCKGFNEDGQFTVNDWLTDQGITEYNEMGEDFKNITLHSFFQNPRNLTPQKIEMFFLACYNVDKFRSFVFESSFLDKFDIPDDTVQKIKADDLALLRFGYDWLRFSLFGEKTMTIQSDIAEDKVKELQMKRKLPKE